MANVDLIRNLRWSLDILAFTREALKFEPDPIQAKFLQSPSKRIIANIHRQWGKSTCCSIIALHAMVYAPGTQVIVVSPSMNQSVELGKKLFAFFKLVENGPEAEQDTTTRLALRNGSRCICLPGSEQTVRGYSADLLIADEASRIEDELYDAMRPMRAAKPDSRFIMVSTPFGRMGQFYETWSNGTGWERFEAKAKDCPRISPEFLQSELEAMGPIRFAQEYECQFIDGALNAFDSDLIENAFVSDFKPFEVAA